MRTSKKRFAAAGILCAALGCGGEPSAPERAAQSGATAPEEGQRQEPGPPALPDDLEPAAQDGKTSSLSNAGTYRVTWRADPSPIPLNAGFSLDVWIEDAADPRAELASISLAADAAMPDHGHGMIRQARVTRNADGSFRVDGMMFHMPGYWELYLDVLRGAVRERAQFAIELE